MFSKSSPKRVGTAVGPSSCTGGRPLCYRVLERKQGTVRKMQICWWMDTHGDNFNCLKNCSLPEFDQCFSALIEDLSERNMLDEALLLLTSEMGRKPKIGDPRNGGVQGQGRDHWTHCLPCHGNSRPYSPRHRWPNLQSVVRR